MNSSLETQDKDAAFEREKVAIAVKDVSTLKKNALVVILKYQLNFLLN
jgi:hypothetical protein